jgi:drug/metabolite transporter (DMT)-like permease
MTVELWAFGLAFGANLVIGAVMVFVAYGLMERHVLLGAVGGLALGAIIVWVQATAGQMMWDLAFEGKRNLVVTAGIGAALGLVGTMMTVKPELE